MAGAGRRRRAVNGIRFPDLRWTAPVKNGTETNFSPQALRNPRPNATIAGELHDPRAARRLAGRGVPGARRSGMSRTGPGAVEFRHQRLMMCSITIPDTSMGGPEDAGVIRDLRPQAGRYLTVHDRGAPTRARVPSCGIRKKNIGVALSPAARPAADRRHRPPFLTAKYASGRNSPRPPTATTSMRLMGFDDIARLNRAARISQRIFSAAKLCGEGPRAGKKTLWPELTVTPGRSADQRQACYLHPRSSRP